MLTPEENELLCRVGSATPMGGMLRRYWLPAATSDELVAGGAPRRTRLLGENFLAFRTGDGDLGVVEENCPHRGASLLLARNEACGLRCLYHGWVIAPDGSILEAPAEPPESTFAQRVRAQAYPVYEAGGIVWTYIGPPGTQPPEMHFDWMRFSADHRIVLKARIECNWVQCLEGVIDPAHTMFLHSNLIDPTAREQSVIVERNVQRPTADRVPRIELDDTPYGFRYASIRKPLVDPELRDYVRITHFIAPCFAIFPAASGWTSMQLFLPLDDEHTMFYFIQTQHDAPITPATRAQRIERSGMVMGVDLDEEYRKVRTPENTWLQDRAAMAAGSYSGLHGLNTEDFAVQESMGPIYDRSKEHLGATDVGVARMRRIMIEGARRFTSGQAPPVGLANSVDYGRIRAEERMVPHGERWQTPVTETERAPA